MCLLCRSLIALRQVRGQGGLSDFPLAAANLEFFQAASSQQTVQGSVGNAKHGSHSLKV
jgi:hypothetical protein